METDQLIYFELDEASGGLLTGKLESKGQKIFKQKVRCLDLGEVPEGR